MRRIARLDRSIGPLRSSTVARTSSPNLCLTCQHQATSFSTGSPLRAKKIPWTETLRRRMWGTDQPPGKKDPYGGMGNFEKRAAEWRGQQPVEEEVEEYEEGVMKNEAGQKIYTYTTDDPNYEPAATWEGLDQVGGYHPTQDILWDQKFGFRAGFQSAEIMTDPGEIKTALHRAMVEVFAWKQAGMPLDRMLMEEPDVDLTHEIHITPTKEEGASLEFRGDVSMEKLLLSLMPSEAVKPTESEEDLDADKSDVDPLHDETATKENPTESEEDVAADRSEVDPLNKDQITYDELVQSWDPSWTRIALADPEIKFAVMKRMFQLSGIKFPDAAIKKTKDASIFLQYVIKPAKPRKLIEALAQKEELLNLPNVSVYAKRVTPVDKEKAVGRWKLIEEELKARELPVTGHN